MHTRLAVLVTIGAGCLLAQDTPLPSGSVNINLTKESPVALVSMTSDQSSASARGPAILLDLHMAYLLRNTSASRIHGVMLRVVTQEGIAGGKGSVTYPSLNVGPNEVFPVRIDLQLSRPSQAAGPLVQVDLDGVLYQDLSFYGPDRMHSRRYLTACELEAQRDRDHLKRVLAQKGKEGLRQEMLQRASLQQRKLDAAPLNVRVVRNSGSMVTNAALPPQHTAQFALVQFPDAPVEPVEGWAQISGNEARTPHIDVINKSGKPVKYVELGWILSDQAGHQSMAATLPSAERDLYLPGRKSSVMQETTLRLFTSNGQPANVAKMTGYVSQVEFADGKMWVPNRENLADPMLRQAVAPSAEDDRLLNLYLKGVDVLIEELKKF